MKRRVVVAASSQVVQRVYYPAHVHSSGIGGVFSMAHRQHADAVYENAIRFLEDVTKI